MTPLTDAELEELEALAKSATPGPWFFQPKMQLDADGCMTVPTNLGWVSTDPKADYLTVVSSAWDGDALYIAAVSPGVAQRLIATIRAQRREIARLREAVTAFDLAVNNVLAEMQQEEWDGRVFENRWLAAATRIVVLPERRAALAGTEGEE